MRLVLSSSDKSLQLETRKGFTVFSVPATQINRQVFEQLSRELNIGKIFDEAIGKPNVAEAELTRHLRNFSNREKIADELVLDDDGRLEVGSSFNSFELPVVAESVLAKVDVVAPGVSSNLVELISSRSFETEVTAVQLAAKLDRYDLAWLKANLPGVDVSSPAKIVGAIAPETEALAIASSKLQGILTDEQALVYQHQIAGTDLRFKDELVAVLGAEKYDLYQAQAKVLIAEDIKPVTAEGEVIQPFRTQRPDVVIPLPEMLQKGLQPGIVLGKPGNKLSLALGNPQDYNQPDTEYLIEYKNAKYSSVQAAFTAISNTIPDSPNKNKQLYALTVDLMAAKFVQHPQLMSQIEANGGKKWLYSCSHESKNSFWAGVGKDSALINLINKAYERASLQQAASPAVVTSNGKKVIKFQPQGEKTSAKTQSNSGVKIVGKPIAMHFPLHLHGRENPLPVNDCFDAMRGHGRTHTTRNFEPYKIYGFKQWSTMLNLNASGRIRKNMHPKHYLHCLRLR